MSNIERKCEKMVRGRDGFGVGDFVVNIFPRIVLIFFQVIEFRDVLRSFEV